MTNAVPLKLDHVTLGCDGLFFVESANTITSTINIILKAQTKSKFILNVFTDAKYGGIVKPLLRHHYQNANTG